jgi:hypothetical protein
MKEDTSKKERGMTISLWMNQETLDEIDKTADWANIRRSKLIQNLIDVGIEEINIFNALGIIKLSLITLDLKKQWQRACSEIEERDSIGEKRITDRGVNISIWVSQSQIQDIELLSKKLSLSRSQLIERMIDMGMADMKKLRLVGVTTMAKYLRDLHETWKASFKKTEKAYKDGTLELKENGKD